MEEWLGEQYEQGVPPYVGLHLWVIAGVWGMADQIAQAEAPGFRARMGPENLLTITGIYCLHCGAGRLPELMGQPCLPLDALQKLVEGWAER